MASGPAFESRRTKLPGGCPSRGLVGRREGRAIVEGETGFVHFAAQAKFVKNGGGEGERESYWDFRAADAAAREPCSAGMTLHVPRHWRRASACKSVADSSKQSREL